MVRCLRVLELGFWALKWWDVGGRCGHCGHVIRIGRFGVFWF